MIILYHSTCPHPGRRSARVSSIVPVGKVLFAQVQASRCRHAEGSFSACTGEYLFSYLGCLAAGQGLLGVFIHRCLVLALVSVEPVYSGLCTATHAARSDLTILNSLFQYLFKCISSLPSTSPSHTLLLYGLHNKQLVSRKEKKHIN